MNSVKISVIVPFYNTEKYIGDCLFSILNQTFTDFEIICIDDGSTDNSLEIVKNFAQKDNRIRIIHFDENCGVSHARNVGLSEVKGEYVLFIDSDDTFELEALGECYAIAKRLSLDMLIFKLLNYDNKTGEKIYRKNFEMEFLKNTVGEDVFNFSRVADNFFKISPTIPGKFFKRTLLSGMKFNEGLIFEDNPFFIEVFLKANRIYFYNKHLYNRRLRDDSITHSFFDSFSDCVEIYEFIMEILEDNQVYEIFKEQLLKNQCKDIFNRFSQVSNEYKKEFFEKIQFSFLKLRDKLEENETLPNSDKKTQVIFYSAIYAKTEVEYELLVNNYILKTKKRKLEKKVKSYKKDNKKLKKKNKELKKANSELVNSHSWKLTEPLRMLKRIFGSE